MFQRAAINCLCSHLYCLFNLLYMSCVCIDLQMTRLITFHTICLDVVLRTLMTPYTQLYADLGVQHPFMTYVLMCPLTLHGHIPPLDELDVQNRGEWNCSSHIFHMPRILFFVNM